MSPRNVLLHSLIMQLTALVLSPGFTKWDQYRNTIQKWYTSRRRFYCSHQMQVYCNAPQQNVICNFLLKKCQVTIDTSPPNYKNLSRKYSSTITSLKKFGTYPVIWRTVACNRVNMKRKRCRALLQTPPLLLTTEDLCFAW